MGQYIQQVQVSLNPTIFNIIRWVAGLLGHRLIEQASEVPSIIFFHDFLQNSLQKSFQLYNFTKKKLRVLSALSPSQQPTVLFSIYQNNTWTIRPLVNEMIDPAT